MTQDLSRRAILAGSVAIVPAASIPAFANAVPLPVSDEDADPVLLDLYRKLLQARKHCDAVCGAGTDPDDETVDAVCGAVSDLEFEISTTHATTLFGLLIKARAALGGCQLRDIDLEATERPRLEPAMLLLRLARDVVCVCALAPAVQS